MSDAQATGEATDRGWFSVRCVLQHGSGTLVRYEERITVWRAVSFDVAIALAETEAVEYADEVGASCLGFAQAYRMFDEPAHGAEVYSLMRDSELPPDAYLTAFFDTGRERQGLLDAAGQQEGSTATNHAEQDHEVQPPTG